MYIDAHSRNLFQPFRLLGHSHLNAGRGQHFSYCPGALRRCGDQGPLESVEQYWLVLWNCMVDIAMGQNPVPLVNIPKMNIKVFIGMFTYPLLMVIGINPWPY